MSSPLLFLIASLIWGSTFWAITLQLGEVAPAVSVVYRFGLASAVLFAWCFLRGQRLALPWKTQRWLISQGFATFAFSYVCTYAAEQYVVSALVAVLYALIVFWNPIGERLAFGTPLTWRILGAGLLSIVGVALLFFHSIDAAWNDIVRGGRGQFLLGLGLALAATVSSTIGNLLVIKVREESSNVLLTLAWAMFWGCSWVALWIAVSGQHWRIPANPSYWFSLLYLALFGSVFAFAAYFTLIHRIGARKAIFIGVVTPVISVLLSIQFEHYRPGLSEWLGMAVCLCGVAWALKEDAPQPNVHIILNNNPEPL